MTTIYLVTSGEYSNYGINGVFSSEQLAKEFIEKHKDGGIEEWELDERSREEVCPYWRADLDVATSVLVPGNVGSDLADPKTRTATIEFDSHASNAYPKGHIYSISYVSQEHANKLCVEKKQEIQRQGGMTDASSQ